jgi:chromosome segregation ATPase
MALLKNKPLDKIINGWTEHLEKQIDEFQQQAHKVAEWDKKLMANSEKILQLHEQVELIQASQGDLDRTLELVQTKQNELHQLLNNLETEVDKLNTAQPLSPADKEREMGYELADRVNRQLSGMNNSLKELIDKINASVETQDDKNPVGQVIQIMNIHLNSLQWIDQNVKNLEEKISEVDKLSKIQKQKAEQIFRDRINII